MNIGKQAKYAVVGSDYYLTYDYKTYRFNAVGNFVGMANAYFPNSVPVNVMSIAIMNGVCEVAISMGSDFRKFKSKLSPVDITMALAQYGAFYIRMLRRDVDVTGGKIRQMFIVCNSSVDLTKYLDKTVEEVV